MERLVPAAKAPNFVIQESITINNGKITSCYAPANTALANQREQKMHVNENLKMMKEKHFILGMKKTISRKVSNSTLSPGKDDAQLQPKEKANMSAPSTSVNKTSTPAKPQDAKIAATVLVKSTTKAVPTSVIVHKQQGNNLMNDGKKMLVKIGRNESVLVQKKQSEIINFEDHIPKTLTPKQNTNEIAISSEVTLLKTHQVSAVRRNPKNDQHQEAVTIIRKSSVKPQQSAPLATPEASEHAVEPAPVHTSGTKKKSKKKKRRFRNLDAPDDDDWPVPPLPTVQSTLDTPQFAPLAVAITTPKVENKTPMKCKEKIQVLREYIFPSPTNPMEKRDKPIEKDKQKIVKDKDKVEEEKVIVAKREPVKAMIPDDGHLSDDSVSSIQSKMSAISDFNLNGSYGDVDGLNLDGSSTDLTTVPPETELQGEDRDIFCADDDGSHNIYRYKSSDECVLVPTEDEDQHQEETQNFNNNSFEIESKEEKIVKKPPGVIEGKNAALPTTTEDKLLKSAPRASPKQNSERIAEKEQIETKKEIDLEVNDPETLTTGKIESPIRIKKNATAQVNVNEIDKIEAATPMELAFVEAIKGIQSIENEVNDKSTLETLLKQHNQCRIVDYIPSDEGDAEDPDVSIAKVNDLSQEDISKMVLGEGFGAMLVSDQVRDVLQAPPEYKPTPLVLQPGKLVPVSLSPLIIDGHAQRIAQLTASAHAQDTSKVEQHVKMDQKKGKKPLGIGSSTPLQKNKKKKVVKNKIKMFPHVTGDSEIFADVDEKDGCVKVGNITSPVGKGKLRVNQAVIESEKQSNASKVRAANEMWSPVSSADADSDGSAMESSRNSSLLSLDEDDGELAILGGQSGNELPAKVRKKKNSNRLFGKRARKSYKRTKNKSLNEDASLDSSASQSVSSCDESPILSDKPAKSKKKKTKLDWIAMIGGKTMSTRKKLNGPVDIGQELGNSEISLAAMADESIKEKPLDESEIKQEVEDPPNETIPNETHNGCQTPPLSPKKTKNGKMEDLNTTPKTNKSPKTPKTLKLKIRNLLGKPTPLKDVNDDIAELKDENIEIKNENIEIKNENIEIKNEPVDAEDGNEQQKVPKIILKLSPHKSPSIVRSPSAEASPRRVEKSPLNKVKAKRKILSPLSFADELQENVSPQSGSGRKLKKQKKKGKSLSEEELNQSQPLLTDDPELVINLPVDKENTKNLMNVNAEFGNFDSVELKMENTEVVDDENPFSIGDLVLARLGTFSYWPCMITMEPQSKKYCRRISAKKIINYHVRFFGDNGRRAWVLKNAIIRYESFDMLEKHREVLRERQKSMTKSKPEYKTIAREMAACQIKGTVKKAWTEGMKELGDLVDKTVAERHDFFFDMFATKQEKAMKRKRLDSETELEIKKEPDNISIKSEDDDDDEDFCITPKPVPKKRKLEKLSVKKAKKMSPSVPKSLTGQDGRNSRSSKSTPTSSKVRLNREDSPAGDEKHNYVNEDLEEIIKGSLIMKDVKVEDEEKLIKRQRPARKRSSADSKEPKKEFKLGLKKHELGGADVSDSDSTSKTSVQSSGTGNTNRRVLFKDVSKQPVCSVCLQNGGTLVKCKGTCFAFYHPECSQLKDEPKEEDDVVFVSTPTDGAKVDIVNVRTKTKYFNKDEINLNQSDIGTGINLNEQLDNKLEKIMAPIAGNANYYASTTDSSSNDLEIVPSELESQPTKNHLDGTTEDFVCINCKHSIDPPCFSCGRTVYLEKHVDRFRCSISGCGKYFHPECLNAWPQSIIDLSSGKNEFNFKCPMHNCQTCISDNPKACSALLPISKTVRCVKCPATYHANAYCVPAGTEVLSHTQIICPRHVQHKGPKRYTINANWCFICSQGGDLMCCETCPTSVHADCIRINLRADDSFVCEDCESGRLPLYDEIVWAKFAAFKWWPAVILFPEDIPENVRQAPHKNGEFVARFYGTHDHHWFALGRVFLFQEDDKGDTGGETLGKHDALFKRAVAEAKAALVCRKQLKVQRELAFRKNEKPPLYTKIKVNRAVGNLKPFDGNVSSTNACNCTDSQTDPCGPGSDCLNRLLLTECEPEVCPAREKCLNRRFEKRVYPPLVPYKTDTRGWGLKSTEPITKGQFVIEYVGELIDQDEYQRRIERMHVQKAENYYFLTLDGNRTIDAGPKGNLARFMNHCCQPNCETQKWTVRGDTRIGLFALDDIPANTELTFNYNMEPIGDEKKECRCGAENCARFLGAKNKDIPKQAKPIKVVKKAKTKKISTKRSASMTEPIPPALIPCFICGVEETDLDCTMKNCGKVYHIKCMELFSKPQGKWTCPRHYCNVCAKRTTRSCISCLQSYCPMHSNGNILFQRERGYVCNKHNPELPSEEPTTSDPSLTEIKEEPL